MYWYFEVFKKYAVFTGRARRKEYWMFYLFNLIVAFALVFLEILIGIAPESDDSILVNIYCFAIFVPSIAVLIRRLHDTNRSGLWLLIVMVPIIGGLVLLFFLVQDSQASDNRFGPNPKAVTD